MSNVFSNTSFAVLGVMDCHDGANGDFYVGSTVFVQRKPESDYGNLTILSYSRDLYNLTENDFNIQARFEANVCPQIMTDLLDTSVGSPVLTNSNISVNSYIYDGTLIT